jgi:aminoglycoside phosphotransferase (APT) family kinase protein
MTDIPPPTPAGEPTSDVDITPELARALLRDQHPDLAELPIARFEIGWDNEVMRLGDDLALRLPRRRGGGWLILREQHFLPLIAANLPLPAPIPVRIGTPALGYPYSWSVVPWFEGVPTDRAPPDADQGEVLAAFLTALHQPAPDDAPTNPYRGGPLSDRVEAFEERCAIIERSSGPLPPHVRKIWNAALATPIDAPRTWFHGDLHGRNVLVKDGRLAAVIDWGDLGGGDPACDLASIWMLLPHAEARHRAIAAYAASDATWTRARGWAAHMAAMLLAIDNNPRMPPMGAAIVERLLEPHP